MPAFSRIPTVLKPQEIIDKALLKSSKVSEPYFPDFIKKIRSEVIDKISTVESVSTIYLRKLINKFPSLNSLYPFYRGMIGLMVDLDQYRISLGHVQWASDKIVELANLKIKSSKKGRTVQELNKNLKEFYGRFASIIKDLDKDLTFLAECRAKIKEIPDIKMDYPTFIIAGLPNVGKTSLLSKLTGSSPIIAPYPFTTQSLFIGYTNIGNRGVQIIDTPGILDRPMKSRNEMERKSILCLQDLEGILIFLFDHSGSSGYSSQEQENVYNEIKSNFKIPVIRAQSKSDIIQEKKEDIQISCLTGEGLEKLKEIMLEKINSDSRWI